MKRALSQSFTIQAYMLVAPQKFHTDTRVQYSVLNNGQQVAPQPTSVSVFSGGSRGPSIWKKMENFSVNLV
ncbi:hypothetical protein HanRHA438_Chr02g0082271 [Helianthus annuus]|nr:hypothetical protein HanRHA438_Chr02g0082271 [Helianthus annuus]